MRTILFAFVVFSTISGLLTDASGQQPSFYPGPSTGPGGPMAGGPVAMAPPFSAQPTGMVHYGEDPIQFEAQPSSWETSDGNWVASEPSEVFSEEPESFWYANADLLWMKRTEVHDNVTDQVIFVDNSIGSVPAFLVSNTDFHDLDRTGLQVTIGQQIDPNAAFEVTYFGIREWTKSSRLMGNNSLTINGTVSTVLDDFTLADIVNADYSSELQNVEANYKEMLYHFTVLMGFRYIKFDEQYTLASTDFDSSTSHYIIQTQNDLYGGQIGMGVSSDIWRIHFDFLAKGGIYGNPARQSQQLRDDGDTTVIRDFDSKSNTVALVAEISAQGTLELTEWMLLRGGYQAIWIDGVALAPGQIDLTNTASSGRAVRNGATIVVHGVNVGAELHW